MSEQEVWYENPGYLYFVYPNFSHEEWATLNERLDELMYQGTVVQVKWLYWPRHGDYLHIVMRKDAVGTRKPEVMLAVHEDLWNLFEVARDRCGR